MKKNASRAYGCRFRVRAAPVTKMRIVPAASTSSVATRISRSRATSRWWWPSQPAGSGTPRGSPSEECPRRCGRYWCVEAADAPGVREEVALGERVARVEISTCVTPVIQALPRIAGRSPAGRRRASPRRSARRRCEPIGDACVIASPSFISPRAWSTREPRREAGAGGRAVEPAGRDDDGVPRHLADAPPGLRDLDDAHAGDRRILRMDALGAARAPRRGSPRRRARVARLLAARARSRARSRRRSRTTCRRRRRRRVIRAEALDLELRVELPDEARHVRELDALALAVAAGGARLDDAAGRLEPHDRLRLAHLDHPGLEQHGRRADRVRAGHGRVLGRLHDDEAGVAVRPRRRHDEVGVARDASARLAQQQRAGASRRRAASDCICSKTVAPGGGRTPPTITFPISPPAWQPTTVSVRPARILGRRYGTARLAGVTELVAFLGVSAIVIVTPGPDDGAQRSGARCWAAGARGSSRRSGSRAGRRSGRSLRPSGSLRCSRPRSPRSSRSGRLARAYLIWLGLQALAAAVRGRRTETEAPRVEAARAAQGLPPGPPQQPRQPEDGRLLPEPASAVRRTRFSALLALGFVFCLMTFVWLTAYAVAVARAGDFFSRSWVKRAIEARHRRRAGARSGSGSRPSAASGRSTASPAGDLRTRAARGLVRPDRGPRLEGHRARSASASTDGSSRRRP